MSEKEQQIIEKHLDKHNGIWYKIIGRYTDSIRIEWGKDSRICDRIYTKTLKI